MFVRRLVLVFLVLAFTSVLGAETAKDNSNTADLPTVFRAVQSALDTYQSSRNLKGATLPPLKSAEFDFKTTVGTTVGGKISLFIFTFGASHEKDVTSDVSFLYMVPQVKPHVAALNRTQQVSLQDQLVQTIRSAAEALSNAKSFGNLPLSSLTVNVEYCVKNDVNGGGTGAAPFVTVNIGGDRNRSAVQSVRLVFGN